MNRVLGSPPLPQKLPQNLWAFIWYFLKEHKGFAGAFTVLALLTGVWAPLNSILIKIMIDGLSGSEPGQGAAVLLWPAIFFVVNFEVHNMCWRGMQWLNYRFQPVIKNKIIRTTFAYVHGHSHQFFQDNMSGRISSQIITLADNVERIVHDLSRLILNCVVALIITFISMYYVHVAFFIALVVWFFVFFSLSMCMSFRIIRLAEDHAGTESQVSGELVDSITNASNVRIFARRSYELSYIEKALFLSKAAFRRKEKFELNLHFFQGISMTLMLGAMLYFLFHFHAHNAVTVGDFSLILGLSVEVGFMVWFTMENIDELNKSIGKCRQSLSHLFVPLSLSDAPDALPLKVKRGEIIFKHVTFYYKGDHPLFYEQSIKIEAGQKVGLVGYSGGGKTTFANLILRLYDVTGGEILIDGQNIRTVTQDSLREHIAMIPQEASLFHRTLMENIRYGRMEATDEDVIEAAKRAHAHDFIQRLPERYNGFVGERGVRLSGGQRQRISIARAILKNAPILILDEATSQLDSVTENDIQDSLHDLMHNKTTLVIAHRLSTLLRMDRILVFDQGRIVEDGRHTELLKKEGVYTSLWQAQVGGFLPEKRLTA